MKLTAALLSLMSLLTLSACGNPDDEWGKDPDFCKTYHSCDLFCVFHTCST